MNSTKTPTNAVKKNVSAKTKSAPISIEADKVNVRYSGRNHPLSMMMHLRANSSLLSVPVQMIEPLNQPTNRLPALMQSDQIRLVKTLDRFYVVSGFKEFIKQSKLGDTVNAHVYSPKDMRSIALAEVISGDKLVSAVAKLSNNPRLKIVSKTK